MESLNHDANEGGVVDMRKGIKHDGGIVTRPLFETAQTS